MRLHFKRSTARIAGMVAVLSVTLLSSGAGGASEFSTKEKRQAALGSTIRLDDGLKAVFSNDGAFKPLPEPQSGDWLLAHPETGQTYDQYGASFPNRPDASRGRSSGSSRPVRPAEDGSEAAPSLIPENGRDCFVVLRTPRSDRVGIIAAGR